MEYINKDVLVIGGGGAAARAAIEAFDGGAGVMLVTKGKFGSSGATAYPVADFAGLAVADGIDDPTDTPDLHLKDILSAGLGMCDNKLSRILVEESLQVVPDLEKWGVEMERTPSGNYLMTQACFSSRRRNYKLKDHGRKILAALVKQVRMRDITVMEDAMLFEVVVDENRIKGGIVVTGDGKWVVIRTGAIILATGGAGQLFKFNMNPPDITGDGQAVGFRAGAELFNMEYMQYGLGTISPVTLFPFWLWPFKPSLRNQNNEEFMSEYLPREISVSEAMEVHSGHFPFTNRLPSRYLEIAIHKELSSGRGGASGGIRADFTKRLHSRDLTDATRKLWPNTRKWFESRGMNLEKSPVEIACFAHAMNGGLRVNENGETSISGLFAVGETAGGPHGADRLGGTMLTACQVFGKRAGRGAAEKSKQQKTDESCRKAVSELAPRFERFKPDSESGSSPPAEIKREIQELSFQFLLLVRTADGLIRFLKELENVEDKFNHDSRIESPREAMKAIEIENLILTGKILAKAALVRQETRGSQYREDYPDTESTAEWVIVRKGDQGEPVASFVPNKSLT